MKELEEYIKTKKRTKSKSKTQYKDTTLKDFYKIIKEEVKKDASNNSVNSVFLGLEDVPKSSGSDEDKAPKFGFSLFEKDDIKPKVVNSDNIFTYKKCKNLFNINSNSKKKVNKKKKRKKSNSHNKEPRFGFSLFENDM